MKITATYTPEHRAYTIQVDEQQMVVPEAFMHHLVSVLEIAMLRRREELYRAITTERLEREREAKQHIEQANHPAILPFTQEKPETAQPEPKPKGRPKGIHTPKTRLKPKPPPKPPKEPEPLPFRHTPFR